VSATAVQYLWIPAIQQYGLHCFGPWYSGSDTICDVCVARHVYLSSDSDSGVSGVNAASVVPAFPRRDDATKLWGRAITCYQFMSTVGTCTVYRYNPNIAHNLSVSAVLHG